MAKNNNKNGSILGFPYYKISLTNIFYIRKKYPQKKDIAAIKIHKNRSRCFDSQLMRGSFEQGWLIPWSTAVATNGEWVCPSTVVPINHLMIKHTNGWVPPFMDNHQLNQVKFIHINHGAPTKPPIFGGTTMYGQPHVDKQSQFHLQWASHLYWWYCPCLSCICTWMCVPSSQLATNHGYRSY